MLVSSGKNILLICPVGLVKTTIVQPSMMLNYGGTWTSWWVGWSSGRFPYIAMDNLKVTVTDDQGNVYDIDSSDDVGYYPYGSNDPEVVDNGATYMGGLGGIPNWDCNYIGLTVNPWRFGTNMYSNYYNSPNSLGWSIRCYI